MAAEEPKTFIDYAAIWSPIILSFISLIIAWFAFKKAGHSSKEIFINSLRDKVMRAKYTILNLLEEEYSQDKKMIIVQEIQDFLLYQGYSDEKNNFLSIYLRDHLSNLQEEIEDILGLILIKEDISTNKNLATSKLNDFFNQL